MSEANNPTPPEFVPMVVPESALPESSGERMPFVPRLVAYSMPRQIFESQPQSPYPSTRLGEIFVARIDGTLCAKFLPLGGTPVPAELQGTFPFHSGHLFRVAPNREGEGSEPPFAYVLCELISGVEMLRHTRGVVRGLEQRIEVRKAREAGLDDEAAKLVAEKAGQRFDATIFVDCGDFGTISALPSGPAGHEYERLAGQVKIGGVDHHVEGIAVRANDEAVGDYEQRPTLEPSDVNYDELRALQPETPATVRLKDPAGVAREYVFVVYPFSA